MLKKIKKIKNIGILNENSFKVNFVLEKERKQSNDFEKINRVLIFGENSSGKSTFSKLFRSIELFENAPEKSIQLLNNLKRIGSKENIEVELETNSSTIKFNSKSNKWENYEDINIRVFNSDYIRENINLNDFVNNKIDSKYESEKVLLSKEKNIYEELLKSKNKITDNYELIFKEYSEKKLQFEIKYKTRFDSYCIPLFDTQLESIISEREYKDIQKELLTYENLFQKLKRSETFIELDKAENAFLLEEDIVKCITDLNFSEDEVKIKTFNEMLLISEEEREWKLLGLEYINDTKQCPFCKSDITENKIIKQYKNYLNSDSKTVVNNLKKFKQTLNKIEKDIENILILESKITNYSSLIENYSYNVINIDIINNAIEECNIIIDNKISNVFNKTDEKEILEFSNNINIIRTELKKVDILNEFALIINDCMKKSTDKIKKLRQSIKNTLLKLFNYENKMLIEKLNKLKIEKMDIEKIFDIKEKEYQLFLQNNSNSIKVINEYILYLGLSNYYIDSEFNLIYSNNKINNAGIVLSDGEISSLVFAYFCATLVVSNTEEEKKNMIIIIDDPVTSVDYNRIYYFASMIRNICTYVCKGIKINTPPQIVIMTHNYLLFNILLQSNFINKKSQVFELEKKENESKIILHDKNKDTIFIKQLVKIIECADCSNITLEQEIMIPNCIRSVIEQLLHFINPDYESTKKEEIVNFFEISDKEYDILDFYVQHNSHNEPVYNIEGKFTKQQLNQQCSIVSKMIQNKFDKLYDYCYKKLNKNVVKPSQKRI